MAEKQTTKEDIRRYIEDDLRPWVQADGGEIRFVSYQDGELTVKMQGVCATCPCCEDGFREFLKKDIYEKFSLEVELNQIIDKPYFLDKQGNIH